MPIKGLTDRTDRLPRIGKLRTGYKNPKNGAPVAADCFMVGEDTPEELAAAFAETFGDKPTVISPVFVPVDDVEMFASTFYRAYTRSRGLVCKGDGVEADRLVDADVYEKQGMAEIPDRDTKRTTRVPVSCPCPMLDDKTCRPMMMLQLIIPDLPGVGIWQIDTASIITVKRVRGSVAAIQAITKGRIAGVPLELRLIKQEVTPDGMTKKKVNTLELRVMSGMGARDVALSAGRPIVDVPALPVPDDEMPDDSIIPTPEEAELARFDEDRRSSPVSVEQLTALRTLREKIGLAHRDVLDYMEARFDVREARDVTVGVYEDTMEWLSEQAQNVQKALVEADGGESTTDDQINTLEQPETQPEQPTGAESNA